MSESGRTQGRSEVPRRDDAPEDGAGRAAEQVARPLLDDVDGLLDEIDAVLEVNAEEFVRGYVQKGGQ
jgi:ubiquitin-like protein Pup